MKYGLRFLPEIEEDIINGYVWYEGKSLGLGEEFLRMFFACAGDISRSPLQYQKVDGEFRRCLLRRFPYAIYFMIKDDQVIVCGFFHCARDPSAIRMKLHDREKPEKS